MEKNDPNQDENRMIIRSVELEKVLGVTSKLPEGTLPEVAFAGKSNVGKSSLINALLNRKSLARVSQHPGKTQTINYYNVNKELYLVDLPGYGYAEAAEEVKAKWGKMVERYLKNSEKLMNVFLLVDSRHEASANDRLMYEWICGTGIRPVIIATKTDKLKRSKIPAQIKLLRESLGAGKEDVILPFSSETKTGVAELWALIQESVSPSAQTEENR